MACGGITLTVYSPHTEKELLQNCNELPTIRLAMETMQKT
jgi:hypothetical protein